MKEMDRGGGTCYMLTYFLGRGGGGMRRGDIFSGGVEIFLE